MVIECFCLELRCRGVWIEPACQTSATVTHHNLLELNTDSTPDMLRTARVRMESIHVFITCLSKMRQKSVWRMSFKRSANKEAVKWFQHYSRMHDTDKNRILRLCNHESNREAFKKKKEKKACIHLFHCLSGCLLAALFYTRNSSPVVPRWEQENSRSQTSRLPGSSLFPQPQNAYLPNKPLKKPSLCVYQLPRDSSRF